MTVYNYKMQEMKDFIDLINEIGNKRGYKKIAISQEKHFLEVDIEFNTDSTADVLFEETRKMVNKNIMFGSETYPHINGELQRATECNPNSSFYDDEYLDAVEEKLGKFHRGLAVLAKVYEEVFNGGFDQLFSNGYMSTLEETIEFLKIISKTPIIDQTVDEIVKLFEEAVEINKDYEDVVDSRMLYEEFESQYYDDEEVDYSYYDDWYQDRYGEIEDTCHEKFRSLEKKYFDMDVHFFNQLDLLVAENTRCRINLDVVEVAHS